MSDYTFYRTSYGQGGLVFDRETLLRVYLPVKDPKALEKRIKKKFPQAKRLPPGGKKSINGVSRQFERYFQGQKVDFNGQPDPSGLTDFQAKIYQTTQTIPYGEVRSYRWVAERAGFPRAYRAAGLALGMNCWPVMVPCHRVVRSNGSAGGWSGEPGWKERLQQLEKKMVVRQKLASNGFQAKR